MSYVYIQTERAGHDHCTHDLWTVGFYDPSGKWHSESDHDSAKSAAQRVAWLNGSNVSFEE